jgi:hypothetical protein
MHDMKTISMQISELERRLSAASVPLARLFAAAEIDRSTWSRWRADLSSPTLKRWEAAKAAVDELAPNARCTPSPDSTAAHTPESSTHPIRETGVEPQPIPVGVESRSSVDDPDHIASSNLQNEERATARRQVW